MVTNPALPRKNIPFHSTIMKQVRFVPTITIRRLKPLKSVVDEDSGSSTGSTFWLTGEDYNRIRRGIKKDVRKARAASMDENESTLRGVEHLQSAEALQQQIIDKDRAIEAVFREQERQANAGMAIDDGAIARAYLAHSRQARQAAIVRAVCDEAFVLANRTPTTSTSS